MIFKSPKFIAKLKRVMLLTAGWVAAGVYISSIEYVSIIIRHGIMEKTYGEWISVTIAEVTFAGLILGLFEVFYFTDRFKGKSFSYAVVMKSLFYVGGMIALLYLIFFLELLRSPDFTIYRIKDFSAAFFENIGLILLTNFLPWAPVFLISIILLHVSDKYGQGVFLKFISGKYHNPKEETRIFMFLDIKSSTTIAEALGSIKYFELIADFFYDATDAIIECKGEIYQYVGDEIVISWKLKNGVMKNNCLNCFFDIYESVKKKSANYESKYGLVPSFKAGMHYGEVTVGEIGVIKRDIAFSGDVLNTASRIQELCNKYNQKLIVSKDLLDLVNYDSVFFADEIGQLNLRGRAAPVSIFSIRRRA